MVGGRDKRLADLFLIIRWNFKSNGYDIGFKFFYEDEELLSCARADAHLIMQKGDYICDRAGICKLLM